MPSSSLYRHRFGSLLRAYSLIGYAPDRDYRYIEINRHIRQSHPKLMAEDNALALDAYRFSSLDFFYSMAARTSFQEAA